MSGEYYTIGTAVKKSGYSPRQIKNYADMGFVGVMKRDNKTYFEIDRIPHRPIRKDEEFERKNRKYFKPMMELLDILGNYFPVYALKSSEFDKLHDELLIFERKCEELANET